MTEPVTEAGQELVKFYGLTQSPYTESMKARVLAIEQEARADGYEQAMRDVAKDNFDARAAERADLAARIERRLLVMRATREGTTHPYDNGCVDAIDQSIAIVREEASER